MSLLKMYSLLNMGIFHGYVSLLEGIFYGHPTKFGTDRTRPNFFSRGQNSAGKIMLMARRAFWAVKDVGVFVGGSM